MRPGFRRIPSALALLVALNVAALFADPLAPYSADEQHRLLPYAPPTRVHLVDATGRWHMMPFVHSLEAHGATSYREVPSAVAPLRWFPHGAPYRLAGILTCDRHLVGVDAPARLFLLGSDRYGRDVLSRLLLGARLSLLAGALATLLALAIGTPVGIVSGFYGGRLDEMLMTGASLFLSLPWVYLLIAARSLLPLDLQPGTAFIVVVLLIGLVAWARPARVIRAVILAARNEDFVAAARSCGAGDLRILVRHLLPQASGIVLTQAALLVPACVLAEMTLSFLGLGLGEPTPSWGALAAGMLPPGLVLTHWWLAAPVAAMVPVFALYERAASAFADATPASHGETGARLTQRRRIGREGGLHA